MRCLALGEALKAAGDAVTFYGRVDVPDIERAVRTRGFSIVRMDAESGDLNAPVELRTLMGQSARPAHWLVVDSYEVDEGSESRVRSAVDHIAVIDDLANRRHDCDLLLDQNLTADALRYESLVPQKTVVLIGPRFALLRSEFWDAQNLHRDRDGSIRRILVSFGGTDPTRETVKVIEALGSLSAPIAADVVLGKVQASYRGLVEEMVGRLPNVRLHSHVDNMAELMSQADLMIGAGGSTTWERCAAGLPSMTVVVAANQIEATENVARAGATLNLGWFADIDASAIAGALARLIENPGEVRAMSLAALGVVEGRSDGARTVAAAMSAIWRSDEMPAI
jgi:UDP-2,4-diacetamido-2,4,6-trideoxy-beta-L-altropyranose hydrolase